MRSLILFLALFSVGIHAEPMRFVYPSPEMAGDERYLYYRQLFDAALASNSSRYGDYVAMSHGDAMIFQRAVAEWQSGVG